MRGADELRQYHFKLDWVWAIFDAIKGLCDWMFYLAALVLSLYLVVTGRMAVGQIVALSWLFGNMILPLRDMHRMIDNAHENCLQLDTLMATLNEMLDPSFHYDPTVEPTNHPRSTRGVPRPCPPPFSSRAHRARSSRYSPPIAWW